MRPMFRYIVINYLIPTNLMNRFRYSKPFWVASDIKLLTVEEQKAFLKVAAQPHNYPRYAFLIQIKLQTDEMIGLTWDCIDQDNHILAICRMLDFRYQKNLWRAGSPKVQHSYRSIPLTAQAYDLFRFLYETKEFRK